MQHSRSYLEIGGSRGIDECGQAPVESANSIAIWRAFFISHPYILHPISYSGSTILSLVSQYS